MNERMESGDGSIRFILGDCVEAMLDIPEGSVALICTDPPYFRVKGEEWDRQWSSEREYLRWMGLVLDQCARVLAGNGSLYLFSGADTAWGVERVLRRRLRVLNRIVWRKSDGTANDGGQWSRIDATGLREYYPRCEYIFFAEQMRQKFLTQSGTPGGYGGGEYAFDALRRYLAEAFDSLGWSADRLNDICGTSSMAGRHFIHRSQWALPTEAQYAALRRAAEAERPGSSPLRRTYEELRAEFSRQRRFFQMRREWQYTDVWEFATVATYPHKHPCEKPADMIAQIIHASSRPGDTVLDCFAGSGVVGQVARDLGRKAILIERDPHWLAQARRRVEYLRPAPLQRDIPLPLFD